MAKSRRVTMSEVARQAGVSVATVSAVVNNTTTRFPVSEKTRVRVLQAIEALGYEINEQARSLRTGRSHTIGLLVSDITQPFSGEMLKVVEREVNARNYSFLISDVASHGKREERYGDLFRQRQVDGLLFLGTCGPISDAAIGRLVEAGTPVVLTERELPAAAVPSVLVDNRKGVALAVGHLVDLGHREITFVNGPADEQIAPRRLAGYEEALAARGLRDTYYDVVEGGLSVGDGYRAMAVLLERQRRPQAVVFFNDSMALGAIKAIHERGLRIPHHVSVIGFDDVPLAEYATPPLTTVKQPVEQMCTEGVSLLLDILEGKCPRDHYRKVVLEPELIVRETTAAPSTGA